MKALTTTLALTCLLGIQMPVQAAIAGATASFDDLSTPPDVDKSTGLFFANGGSSLYAGVTWEPGLTVVGDQYRVDPGDPAVPRPPGPLFGIPHSGRYFLTNQGDGLTNDKMVITTTMVLTGAWFGRNEYYGFGGGADQVTIHAMGASGILGSKEFDLPELLDAQPELLTFVDTSTFASLAGITGYRIDRREIGTQAGNWVADDFSFIAAATVPEPESFTLLLAGLGAVAWVRRRKQSASSPARYPSQRVHPVTVP